jgi:hypothetical protein
MKHVVELDEGFAVFKTYEQGPIKYARVVARTSTLKEAMKLAEDVGMGGGGAVPVNNVGQGNIAGLDIGLRRSGKKKKRKWITSLMPLRS